MVMACCVVLLWMAPGTAPEVTGSHVAGTRSPTPAQPEIPEQKLPLNGAEAGQEKADDVNTWKSLWGPYPRPSDEQIEAFFDKHGRTPANYLAAFALMNDPRWLKEALERFPNHPMPLFAQLFQRSKTSAEDRHHVIERLKILDPGNPLTGIYVASELFKGGKPDEGKKAITEAMAKQTAYYTYESERSDAQKQFREFMSHDTPYGGYMTAVMNPGHAILMTAIDSSEGLRKAQAEAAAANDLIRSRDAMLLRYNLAQMFNTPEAARVSPLAAMWFERNLLIELPPDSAVEFLPMTPAARLAELKKFTENFTKTVEVKMALMDSHNATLILEYVRRIRYDGELAAGNWLLTKMPAQPAEDQPKAADH